MNLHQALGMHHTPDGDIAPLARPVCTIKATALCESVDEAFRTDPDLTCLAIQPRPGDTHQRWGLVSRGPFMSAMAGRLGFGRSVHARRPISDLTDWDALVLHPQTPIASAAEQILTRGRTFRYSEVLVTPTSLATAADQSFLLLGPAQREPAQMLFLEVEDVLRALAAHLTRKALTDPLTQLANREHFLQQLDAACEAASVATTTPSTSTATTGWTSTSTSTSTIDSTTTAGPTSSQDGPGPPLVVAYIDIDHFKSINDGHGHATGDQVLQLVADRLRAAVRPEDLIARLGGDEFALLVHPPLGTSAQVLAWAQDLGARLLRHLSEPVLVAGRTLPGQASIGVAISRGSTSDRAVDPAVLLNEADLAMYGAKAAGGSRCAVVDSSGAASVTTAHAPDRTELQNALDTGQFVLHFQPIVEALSGRLRSTEALVRWQHPTRGLLAPVAFLHDVGTAGFAATLDDHVLELALAQHATWQHTWGEGAPEFINVNLSVPGLLQVDLASRVLTQLHSTGLAPGVLRLELPEVATSAHLAAAAPALAALREAGVGVTLDDVGSGAAGLGHLRELHLDGIKIDRRFVAGMLTDERDAAVVRMLAEMGLQLGVAVTAEGAETLAHLDALQVLARARVGRVLHVQGYAVSRPVSAEELQVRWRDAGQAEGDGGGGLENATSLAQA